MAYVFYTIIYKHIQIVNGFCQNFKNMANFGGNCNENAARDI